MEKIRGWVKNMWQRNSKRKSVYEDFTPIDSIEKTDETLQALHWALHNKNVKNIALTGPYGAGKSSVISSYIKHYKLKKYITISLATFEEKFGQGKREICEDEKAVFDEGVEEELEKGILKQLFYKVKANKIPRSRYRKLHHVGIWKYILGVIGAIIFAGALAYLLSPVLPQEKVELYKYFLQEDKNRKIAIGALLITIIGFANVIKAISSRIFINEVSVGDVSAKGNELEQNSVLNRNIDEILYFFERTKYKVVFIEDLDRFDSTSIFVKLRELNTILNHYDALAKRHRIVFVYAVRDDLFKTDKERTKFFDFTIPVIPVINTTNSEQILRDMLGRGHRKTDREYPEHNISDEFIRNVSAYIGDMRVLISIMNEFWVYKRKLKDSNAAKLVDEQMLAMVIYKNLRPDDFALIEEEKGDIKCAFESKKIVIQAKKEELEQKRQLVEIRRKDVANSVKEIKLLILSKLTNDSGIVSYIEFSSYSDRVKYSEMLSEGWDFNKIRNTAFEVYYRTETGGSSYKKYKDLENSSEDMRQLFKRYDGQKVFEGKSNKELKVELENIEEKIIKLQSNSLQKLMKESAVEDVFPKQLQENKILMFMLRHGYINETYADYINYFHEGSISQGEMNFILSVKNREGVGSFEYTITHCKNTVDKLLDYEFEQKETLNFDIMQFLLNNSKEYEKQLRTYVKQLSDGSYESKLFIKQYIDQERDTVKFLKQICHENEWLWYEIKEDNELSKNKKDIYLQKILAACELEDIVNNDHIVDESEIGSIKSYIESDPDIFKKLADVPEQRMEDLFGELNLILRNTKLEGIRKELLLYIVDNWYYELNYFMVEQIYCALGGEHREKLFLCNFYTLQQLGNSAVLDYIKEYFKNYVEYFIIELDTNTEEPQECVDQILENLKDENAEILIDVIKKERLAFWKTLDACVVSEQNREAVWNFLANNGRIKISWYNYLLYHKQFGYTEQLNTFVNSNVDKLLEDKETKKLSDDIFVELLKKIDNPKTFSRLIGRYRLDEFNERFEDFDTQKLEIMIRKHYFSFNPERYIELRKLDCYLAFEFGRMNQNEFCSHMKECELELEDIKEILKSNVLEENEIRNLLAELKIEDMDEDVAYKIRQMNFLVDRKYAEKAWVILKNEDRFELLYHQLENYSLDEIADKFAQLGGNYKVFAERKRHQYKLYASEYNRNLCKKLERMNFLSVLEEKEQRSTDGQKEMYIIGNIKASK